jgi:hypothetical protein
MPIAHAVRSTLGARAIEKLKPLVSHGEQLPEKEHRATAHLNRNHYNTLPDAVHLAVPCRIDDGGFTS